MRDDELVISVTDQGRKPLQSERTHEIPSLDSIIHEAGINPNADKGGWGYGQFEDGKPNRSEALMKTCAPCHARGPRGNDLVFTHYSR